jgi:hypothetical protein
MKSLQIVVVTACFFLVSISSTTAQPGYYGQVYAKSYPYSFGYTYVTSGYGNRYHPYQAPGPQFSIAKVKKEQNSLGYEYSISESGPNHHKHVHQSANTGGHLVSVSTIPLPAPIPHQDVVYYPQHHHHHHPQPQIITRKHHQVSSGYIQPQPLYPSSYPQQEGILRQQQYSPESLLPLSSPSYQSIDPTLINSGGGEYFYGSPQPQQQYSSPVDFNLGGVQYERQAEFPYAYGYNNGNGVGIQQEIYSGGNIF